MDQVYYLSKYLLFFFSFFKKVIINDVITLAGMRVTLESQAWFTQKMVIRFTLIRKIKHLIGPFVS
jgi:hypothetical protein